MTPPPPVDPGSFDPFDDDAPTERPSDSFVNLSPDAPVPKPVSPLEGTQMGLTPKGREEILKFAHEKSLPTDDPVFQLMEIVRQNDLRGDERLKREEELFQKINSAVGSAPEKLIEACSSLNLVAADHGRAIAATHNASEKAIELSEQATKALKVINRRSWVGLGVCGLLLLISIIIGAMGINSIDRATALTAGLEQAKTHLQYRDDLALKVINVSWERMLLEGRRAFIKQANLGLHARQAAGTLSKEDLEYRDFLTEQWEKLNSEEEELKAKEGAVKDELNKK